MSDAPRAIGDAGSASGNAGEFYVWGGHEAQTAATSEGLVWIAGTNEWHELPTDGAPSPRIHPHVHFVPSLSELVVWGSNSGALAPTDGARFSAIEWTWKPMSFSGAPSPRFAAVSTIVGGETSRPLLVVFGGQQDLQKLDTGGVYDFATDTWSPLPKDECAPGPRAGHTLTALSADGRQALVWGGIDGDLGEPLAPEQGFLLTLSPE
jgi:hypothetical protein